MAKREPSNREAKLTDKQARFVDEYLINVARFQSYVDSTAGADKCWVWMGAKDERGYGRFHIGIGRSSTMLAHRIAHALACGELPEAVCHSCDNPSCCNPVHLFSGTRAINNLDMMAKGRHWSQKNPELSTRGESHGSAKLTEKAVKSIRTEYGQGGLSQRELAKRYGVSQRTICKVLTGKGWLHVA